MEGSYRLEALNTTLRANVTHLFGTEDQNGNPILRVPEKSANLFVDYDLSDTIRLGANLQYVDERWDYGGVKLDSYTLLNLSYSQKIGESLSFNLQVRNLLDEDYETAAGYSSEGRSVYGTVEYRF